MRDIPGFEGKYAITEDGRVWSYPIHWHNTRGATFGHDGRYMKIQTMKTGYKSVRLSSGSITKTKTIHRLLAITYIPNPLGLKCVNHKDGDKQNNSLDNLEWCTYQHNVIHALRTGLIVPHKPYHNDRCTCFKCRPERRGLGSRLKWLKGNVA